MTEQLNNIANAWWAWMWPMFWQVGLLIVLIGAVDLIIRKRAWPQVRYALWLLVLVKLVLPPTFSLSTSVTSKLPPLVERITRQKEDIKEVANILCTKESSTANDFPFNESTEPVAIPTEPEDGSKVTVPAVVTAVGLPAEAEGQKLSWRFYLMGGWIAGVVILALLLMTRLHQLRRIRVEATNSYDVPQWLGELLGDTAERLNLHRIPEVVFSKRVTSPAVFGMFRPVLLLPGENMPSFSRKDIEHVFLHELAHIKRGDLWVHSVYMVFQLIYWFNPLLWFVRRQLQHLRELCCDATVAGILREQTEDYRRTVVETARRLLDQPVRTGMGLLGLFEDANRLLVRLKWLEKKTWKHRTLRIITICALVTLMFACVLPMAKARQVANASGKDMDLTSEQGRQGSVSGRVTFHGTDAPAAGVVVRTVSKWFDTVQTHTDAQGGYTLAGIRPEAVFHITAEDEQKDLFVIDMPAAVLKPGEAKTGVDLTLYRGRDGSISGKVVGRRIFYNKPESLGRNVLPEQFERRQDSPLAGVKIILANYDEVLAETVTDGSGCYKFNRLRADDYIVRARQPAGVVAENVQTLPMSGPGRSENHGSSQSRRVELESGAKTDVDFHFRLDWVSIAGRVTDAGGSPVGGAEVTAELCSPVMDGGEGRSGAYTTIKISYGSVSTITDEDGRYQLDGLCPVAFVDGTHYLAHGKLYRRYEVRVRAEGYSPARLLVPPMTEHLINQTSQLMEDHRGMFRKQGSLFADVVLPDSQANNITGIDLVLQKAAVIAGRVLDSKGKIVPEPRSRASLRLVPAGSGDDKTEPLLVQMPDTTGFEWIALDEMGRFRIDNVPPGSYLFKVARPQDRRQQATNEPLMVTAGQIIKDIEVIVPTEGPSEIELPPASEDDSVVTSAPVTYLPDSQKRRQRKTDEVRYEGRTIEQWISQFDSESYDDRREAIGVLTRIGRPVVPAMIEQMKKGGMCASCARGVLEKMGPEAEDAVPWLIEVALDKDVPISKGWESKASYRENVVSCLYSMTWARDRVVPVLQRIAGDNEDNTRLRRVAILFLRDVGKEAIPILRNLTETLEGEVQNAAHHMLAQLLEREGGLSKEDYYTPLVEKDPFGASVPEYLAVMKSPGNLGRPNPLTQKIKRLYRQRLEEEPNAHLAWQLAAVIQYGLRNTELTWAAPTDGSIVRWSREDPTESFATLAQVLQLGFDRAESGSQLRRQFGISLAKLRLLQGDWDRMNAMLKELGQGPIPKESRRWLPAPPADWRENLSSRWVAANGSIRSGNCSLEFRIEKDGRGLKGAHFLVKKAPEPTNVFQTGISIDTLFFQPYPFSFGYRAEDRPMTRYAVSDESGIVRFDKLPDIPIKIEVLVPTSNFVEAQSDWDLWMEVEPGKFKIAKVYGTPEEVIDVRKPPAVVELKEGQTVYYPRLIVRPAVAEK